MQKQLEFRGISRSLLIEYILKITDLQFSEIVINENNCATIEKNGFTITVSQEERLTISSITIPRVLISFQGEEEIIGELIQKLRQRTIRIGG